MKQVQLIMGMPIALEVVGGKAADLTEVFDYFRAVDTRFSTYKKNSEISRLNRGELAEDDFSPDMKTILKLCEQTKTETDGFFNIWHGGKCDPSGLVKGWAIQNAAAILKNKGFKDYYVDAGGDIQVSGHNDGGKPWNIGIRNPFNRNEIIKILNVGDGGVATSGPYIRGQHIYNPFKRGPLTEIASLTVIAANIMDADRFATAAYAMGLQKGLAFIENRPGLEAYAVDHAGLATYTSGFEKYVAKEPASA